MNLSPALLSLSLALSFGSSTSVTLPHLSSGATPGFVSGASVVPRVGVVPGVATSPTRAFAASWTTIHDYIETHATSYTESTVDDLRIESMAGQKTWTLTGGATAARGGGRPLDGNGLGWPRSGRMVLFATYAEARHCATMIDDFRSNGTALPPAFATPSAAAADVRGR